MIRDGEFDVAELSLSSYLMARARKLPFTAIPVFPRRLFSQSQIWINSDRDIRTPQDLIGKRVGSTHSRPPFRFLQKGICRRNTEFPGDGSHGSCPRKKPFRSLRKMA